MKSDAQKLAEIRSVLLKWAWADSSGEESDTDAMKSLTEIAVITGPAPRSDQWIPDLETLTWLSEKYEKFSELEADAQVAYVYRGIAAIARAELLGFLDWTDDDQDSTE